VSHPRRRKSSIKPLVENSNLASSVTINNRSAVIRTAYFPITNVQRYCYKNFLSLLLKANYISSTFWDLFFGQRELQVLLVRQEVLNYSVTYRQRLDDRPNSMAKSLFQRTNHNRRLKRYYPADITTRF